MLHLTCCLLRIAFYTLHYTLHLTYFLDVAGPHDTVVHTHLHIAEVAGYATVPLIEPVPTHHVALRCNYIAVPPKWCQKGHKVAVVGVEDDGVIAIPLAFLVMTMRDCQALPILTSLSKSALTLSLQCSGMGTTF